jgi:hypothetical protein
LDNSIAETDSRVDGQRVYRIRHDWS